MFSLFGIILVFLGSVELTSLFSLGLRSPVNFRGSYTKDS